MRLRPPAYLCAAIVAAQAACLAEAPSPSDIATRRLAVVEAAQQGPSRIDNLLKALDDPSPLVRRPAARGLATMGKPARQALMRALGNDDFLVRRPALQALCSTGDPQIALQAIAKCADDPHPLVRTVAVSYLAAMTSRPPEAQKLLEAAQSDPDAQVREIASQALWPYFKETVSIRNRADWDHQVVVAKTIPLPAENWKFHLDPQRNGHLEKWFNPDFDDSQWKTIPIEKAWNLSGYDHEGVAWYRKEIELPDQIEHAAVEIMFDGVDEMTWVWLNGEYVGQHDIGMAGWNIPFGLDITEQLKWGRKNLLTVRVLNMRGHGGIWKPVRIEVLK